MRGGRGVVSFPDPFALALALFASEAESLSRGWGVKWPQKTVVTVAHCASKFGTILDLSGNVPLSSPSPLRPQGPPIPYLV